MKKRQIGMSRLAGSANSAAQSEPMASHEFISNIESKMGVSINGGTQTGWFRKENPIKMDDVGVPPFIETPN